MHDPMCDPGTRRGASSARGDCARCVKRGTSQGSVVWRNPRDRSPRRVSLPKNSSAFLLVGFMSSHRYAPHFILTCRPAYPRGGTGVHSSNHPPALPRRLPGPLAADSGKSRPPSAARYHPPASHSAPRWMGFSVGTAATAARFRCWTTRRRAPSSTRGFSSFPTRRTRRTLS